MKLSYTRAMVRAALEGKLDNVETNKGSVFGLAIPTEIPGVPTNVLNPRDAWADTDAYDKKAKELADQFRENFKKFGSVSEDISSKGGPII